MVAKKHLSTTYHQNFKSSSDSAVAKSYVDCSDYRFERRLNECNHSTDAFEWKQPEWDNSSDHTNRKSLPPHIYKHMKFNEAYNEQEIQKSNVNALTKLNLSSIHNDTAVDNNNNTTSDTIIQPSKQITSTPAKKKIPTKNVTSEKEQCEKVEQRKHRKPTRPTSAYSTLVPRFSSKVKKAALDSRPGSAPVDGKKPPFVAYGCKYKEHYSNKKVTHNVNAATGVSEAALRAQRRMQWDINRRAEMEKKKQSNIAHRQSIERERKRRDMSVWESEYRRNFIEYNDLDYRTATPARMIVSRAGSDLMLTI